MASFTELRGALEALLRVIRSGKALDPNAVLLSRCDALVDQARRGLNTVAPWTPFTRAEPTPLAEAPLRQVAAKLGIPLEEARAQLQKEIIDTELFVNSRYQVARRPYGEEMIYLSIKRIDQMPIRAWRDLQRIKNELVGPECEGLEIYPAESRLLDAANQYHLFVLKTPGMYLPFGHSDVRLVGPETGGGEGQEPFEE
jgi:hypothetical protein